MTRRLVCAVTGLLGALAGLWLVLAPFALGIQPRDADWTDETWTNVATGAGLVLVGLICVLASATALHQHLVDTGLVTPRPKHAPAPQQPEPEPVAAPAPASTDGTDSELKALLAPLVTALTQDLDRDRRDGNQAGVGNYQREQTL